VLVRRVSAQEWVELRELRLRALADAPDAFLTTLAEVQGRSDDDWCEWAEHSAKSMDSAVFVDDGFSGLAGGFVQEPSSERRKASRGTPFALMGRASS